MVKEAKRFIIYSILALSLFGGVVYAAPNLIYQRSILPERDAVYDIGTTSPSNLRYNGAFNNLNVSGTCTGCGGSGSGNVATSSSETSGYVPYWTSTASTPATLGSDAGLQYSASSDRLTLIYASTTAISAGNITSTNITNSNRVSTLNLATAYITSSAVILNPNDDTFGTFTFTGLNPGDDTEFNGSNNTYSSGMGAYSNSPLNNDAGAGGVTTVSGGAGGGADAVTGGTGGDLVLRAGAGGTGSVTGSDGNIIFRSGTGVLEYARFLPSGRLGIGTNAPMNLLDVSGGVAIGSYSGVNTAPSNGLIVSGRVGIGTTTPGSDLAIGNTGDNTINILASATSTFGSGLNIRSGCFSINGTCIGASVGTVGSGTQGQFPFYNAAGTTLTATSTLTVSQDQNIGISTTSPWARLAIGMGSTTPSFVVGTAGSSTPSLYVGSANANGYVGIGTSNPTGQLSIIGRSNVNQLYVKGNPTQSTNIIQVEDSASDPKFTVSNTGEIRGEGGKFYYDGNVTFYIGTGNDQFVMTGNYGGGGELPAGGIIYGFNGSMSFIPSGNNGTAGKQLTFGYNDGTGFKSGLELANIASTNYGKLLLMRTGGQVGIATTSPYGILSVSNTVSTPVNTPLFNLASTTGGTATTSLLTIFPNSNYFVKVGTNKSYGTTTLSGGTATVNNTLVQADSLIFLSDCNSTGLANIGSPYVSAITAGTSFVITSTNVLDSSLICYEIKQPIY